MEWTIEKIRQLPEDNWLGIKRVGPNAWQIKADPYIMMTGDGGVIEYCKAFDNSLIEEVAEYACKANNTTLENQADKLTYSKLQELVAEVFFPKQDGLAKTK